jgi:hypothetical protein
VLAFESSVSRQQSEDPEEAKRLDQEEVKDGDDQQYD